MPFTVEDFHDLIQLLETHPEWRSDLRRLVLTDELLALPQQLAMLQARSEEQFQELLAAQQRTDAQMTTLTEQVMALIAAQQHTDAQVAALIAAQQHTDAQVTTLTEQVTALVAAQLQTDARFARLIDDVGELKGYMLEAKHRSKALMYFHRIVRRPHVLTEDELGTLIEEAREQGLLSEAEATDLSTVDIVLRGRRVTDGTMVHLAVEVSWGIGIHDVTRAARRAALLARTGLSTIPVVAGMWSTPDAGQYAYSARVWQLTEGRVTLPASEEVSC